MRTTRVGLVMLIGASLVSVERYATPASPTGDGCQAVL